MPILFLKSRNKLQSSQQVTLLLQMITPKNQLCPLIVYAPKNIQSHNEKYLLIKYSCLVALIHSFIIIMITLSIYSLRAETQIPSTTAHDQSNIMF